MAESQRWTRKPIWFHAAELPTRLESSPSSVLMHENETNFCHAWLRWAYTSIFQVFISSRKIHGIYQWEWELRVSGDYKQSCQRASPKQAQCRVRVHWGLSVSPRNQLGLVCCFSGPGASAFRLLRTWTRALTDKEEKTSSATSIHASCFPFSHSSLSFQNTGGAKGRRKKSEREKRLLSTVGNILPELEKG